MRENKNRNNSRDGYSRNRDNNEIIPSSHILEKFEEAIPGSVDTLISMAQKEQNHRHNWQDKYLKAHNFTFRIGQLFGLVYNLGLLYVVYDLIQAGEKTLALKLFGLNAAIMIFAILATTIERKVFSRRPPRRGGRFDNRRSGARDNRSNNNRSNDSRDRNQTRKPRAE